MAAFVEQKNWSVVRRETGYGRYDSEAERALLAAIYADLRLYVNFFLPSVKLIVRERIGAKVHKRYDTPTTPYARLLGLAALDKANAARLQGQYLALNPAELRRRLTDNEKKLLRFCSLKEETRRKEVLATV
jgi:lipoate-protein ligase A